MDAMNEALLCRLCGIKLEDEKFKYIFESADLAQKIKETLPITISIDDNGSKYICLLCHDKITFNYKFIQDVLEHNKTLENLSQVKSLFDLSKEVIDLSKIQSDAVYTCPNCNVDLMILLVSNPQGCDYNFQISLAVVDHPDKYHVSGEKNGQICKNVIYVNNSKKTVNVKDKNELLLHIDDTENVPNEISLTLPVIQQNDIDNANESSNNKNQTVELHRNVKRKLEDCNSHNYSLNPQKAQKLDKLLYQADVDLLNCDYDCMGTLIKVEPDDTNWIDADTYCKNVKDIYMEESKDVTLQNEYVAIEENDTIKSCPKIVCELCGARYLSKLKYEFHMERHKLSKMHKYECTLCCKEASNENVLWDHYFHTHKSLQRFVCTQCGKIFAKQSRLKGHQKNYKHSGVKEININADSNTVDTNAEIAQEIVASEMKGQLSVNCSLCGKLISNLDPDAINDLVTCATCEDSTLSLMIDANGAKVISPRQYHCSKCPKHFVRRERLEFHEMRHNENMNEFICSTCGKEFSAENSLYEHYLFVHKGARPHICELCGKSFQLKARLKEHHRTHTGERPYQCDICGQRCRTSNALKLHRKIHFSHSRYTCNICSKSFSKKQNMNEHLEKHWQNDKNISLPQLFTCPVCIENFPTYRMLKYHMMEAHEISNQDPILTKQKPLYECPQCHEKFKHQMSLKAHKEKVHEGKVNPVFRCDICGATYRIKQLLVNHIKSKHDGEKRYKCAQCEKGFNDTKSLYNHISLHTGKKPFSCEFCNMSFRRKDSRDHHRRKHTGEMPYQCPECGESFSTYNGRSKHRKREHGEGETDCPECGEKCSSPKEIRIHLNKHLGEKLLKLQNVESM